MKINLWLRSNTGEEKIMGDAENKGRHRKPRVSPFSVAGCGRLEKAWAEINEQIVPGKLPGDGTDETATRNGLIMAANIIMANIAGGR